MKFIKRRIKKVKKVREKAYAESGVNPID